MSEPNFRNGDVLRFPNGQRRTIVLAPGDEGGNYWVLIDLMSGHWDGDEFYRLVPIVCTERNGQFLYRTEEINAIMEQGEVEIENVQLEYRERERAA